MPPGIVDITWAEIEGKLQEIGQDIEDFIEDPTGWLEEQANSAIEAVRNVWGDITSGTIFSTADLENILNDVLGGLIAGILIEEVKDRLEEENPLLFAGDCEDPEFRNANQDYCNEGNPLFVNEGPSAEDCASQNRNHIPADEASQTDSRCGGCASGYEVNESGECVETLTPCPEDQIRNETTGECEDPPPDYEEGAPCKTPDGEDGTYDADGNCAADPEPEPTRAGT